MAELEVRMSSRELAEQAAYDRVELRRQEEAVLDEKLLRDNAGAVSRLRGA